MDTKQLKKPLRFIDSWLDFRYRRGEWPGYAVAISYKGKIIFNKAYGYANLERKEKLTPNHIFRIASHSKTFTATAIMQLAEKNKLKLSDDIVKYLPSLKKHKDKRFQKITIRQLLSHSAGVIRDGLDSDYWNLERSFPNKEQFIKEILEADLVIDSDKQLKYSNYGFTLLGLIIEKVSGTTYNEYVKKNIIQPLGLISTGPEYNDMIKAKLVTGYSRRDVNKVRLPFGNIDTKVMSAATGFYSTGEDLCKYFTAHVIGSGQLLSDKSKKEMQKRYWKVKNTKEKDGYGFGLIIYKVGKKFLFGHSGGFPGQSTNSMCYLDDNLVIVVLTNCIDGFAKAIVKGIVSLLNEYEKNENKKSKYALSKYEGRFMNTWSIIDFLPMGNKVYSVDPDSWELFDEYDELKYINNELLKIIRANSFSSEDELVHFNFNKQGKIASVTYAGATLLPEAEYLSKQKKLKEIGFK